MYIIPIRNAESIQILRNDRDGVFKAKQIKNETHFISKTPPLALRNVWMLPIGYFMS